MMSCVSFAKKIDGQLKEVDLLAIVDNQSVQCDEQLSRQGRQNVSQTRQPILSRMGFRYVKNQAIILVGALPKSLRGSFVDVDVALRAR